MSIRAYILDVIWQNCYLHQFSISMITLGPVILGLWLIFHTLSICSSLTIGSIPALNCPLLNEVNSSQLSTLRKVILNFAYFTLLLHITLFMGHICLKWTEKSKGNIELLQVSTFPLKFPWPLEKTIDIFSLYVQLWFSNA